MSVELRQPCTRPPRDYEYDFGVDDDGGGKDVDTNAAWRWSSSTRSGEQRITL